MWRRKNLLLPLEFEPRTVQPDNLSRKNIFLWSLDAFAKLRKATISLVMSVRPSACLHGITRLPLDVFLWNLIFDFFFGNQSRKFHFNYNQTKIKGTLHEDQYTFFITCRLVLLRIKSVSDISCKETRNTRFIFNNFYFSKIVPFMR